MMNPNNPRANSEGYPDPTAYEAIKKADGENPEYSEEYARFKRVVHLMHQLCKLCDFEIEEHLVLKDRVTGKIWR